MIHHDHEHVRAWYWHNRGRARFIPPVRKPIFIEDLFRAGRCEITVYAYRKENQ